MKPSPEALRSRETAMLAERHFWITRLRAMRRHDLVQVNACYTTDHEMEPCDDGEWVRFDQIENLIAERER